MKKAKWGIVLAGLTALAAAVPGALHAQLDLGDGYLGTLYASKCPVRINEVMVNPRNDSTEEYVELFNTSWTESVNISGWTLTDGEDVDRIVDYTGPHNIGSPGTSIPPRGYALIVDSDYNGAYNGWMLEMFDYYDGYCGIQCIMVCVDDGAIGNGLHNTADSVTITTNWSVFRDRKYPRQTRSVSWTAEQGFDTRSVVPSWEYTGSLWQMSEDDDYDCSPGVINSCEWTEC